jgi:hypothetical protein
MSIMFETFQFFMFHIHFCSTVAISTLTLNENVHLQLTDAAQQAMFTMMYMKCPILHTYLAYLIDLHEVTFHHEPVCSIVAVILVKKFCLFLIGFKFVSISNWILFHGIGVEKFKWPAYSYQFVLIAATEIILTSVKPCSHMIFAKIVKFCFYETVDCAC